jgi:hypothetical protein
MKVTTRPAYRHTQMAPLGTILYGVAAVLFTAAWALRPLPWLAALFLGLGVLLAVLGSSVQWLTVADEGDRLSVRFGPLPLFRTSVRYEDIHEVALGRARFWEGWGIHYSPWGGWVWHLWGPDCVLIRTARGALRIGTDDPKGLTRFLDAHDGFALR